MSPNPIDSDPGRINPAAMATPATPSPLEPSSDPTGASVAGENLWSDAALSPPVADCYKRGGSQ